MFLSRKDGISAMNDINANLILPSSMCSDNLSISEVSEFVVKEMRKNDIKKLYGKSNRERMVNNSIFTLTANNTLPLPIMD